MGASRSDRDCRANQGSSLESTSVLVGRAQSGDSTALDELAARFMPALRRFAHGRLPPSARRLCDTGDLVQDTVLRALEHLPAFRPRFQGSFLGWLRKILINRLTDVIRTGAASPGHVPIGESLADHARTPLEEAVTREELERFEAALERLSPRRQEAVILFVEMGCSYAEIATLIAAASPDAARMTVQRGIRDLAEAMHLPAAVK